MYILNANTKKLIRGNDELLKQIGKLHNKKVISVLNALARNIPWLTQIDTLLLISANLDMPIEDMLHTVTNINKSFALSNKLLVQKNPGKTTGMKKKKEKTMYQ